MEGENQETPKPNRYQSKDTRSPAGFSTDDVREPKLPFKSPLTLVNASQSRRTTKKTYAEVVSGSGSEDEAEVEMRKKAVQRQEIQERREVVKIPVTMVRSSARSDDLQG